VSGLARLVSHRLEHDELRLERAAMREHYFDVPLGESIDRFVTAVRELTELRDSLLST
jgi:hypothetical protein